ncbi:glucose-1-phosphate cytidylyltransferase [Arsenicibacter rosenii]|uniref:Glucose-1-phosphate cytidylyltransferase n=1 Tax=Arsenicibacter rosenii TaxID=1750698 RepID=A0A1S2VCF7_9BACT|nr:glucose-1-phosphate cytidylyltransferase [Arsenicibacter rosenii]OIN56372.1 glucose-1-phosphate cytidylyltransferase [Arsenicibacter rosenii]
MKVVILAGGLGTRLSEETVVKPKPMVEIGGMPILWHIMKIYSSYGFNEFVVCLGYKGYLIKEYFANYFLHQSDVTVDLRHNRIDFHKSQAEPWQITLVDTGVESMTGGRIKRVRHHIGEEPFMLTYGDGIGNININELVSYHKNHNKLCTLTAVQPLGRFGALNFEDQTLVRSFMEKPKGDGAWVNAGFFICEPQVFDYIQGDSTIWEQQPLETLAAEGQLAAYRHYGFWKPMDTLRDKVELEQLWNSGGAQWKSW